MSKYMHYVSMLLALGCLSACAQIPEPKRPCGPRGRLVKWDQVIHPDYLGEKVMLYLSSTTIPGGSIVNSGTNIWTITFPSAGSTSGSGVTGIEADPGMVMAWAGHIASTSDVPDGWLLCDGTAYSTNTYGALFQEIGFRYSAKIGATFNVPDYRGVALVGVEGDRGLYASTNRVGSGYGATKDEVGSFQVEAYATTNNSEVVRLANTYVHWLIKWRSPDDRSAAAIAAIANMGNSYWPYPIRLPYYLTADTGVVPGNALNQIITCMMEIRMPKTLPAFAQPTEVLGELYLRRDKGESGFETFTLARTAGVFVPSLSSRGSENVYLVNLTLNVPANTPYRIYMPSLPAGTPTGFTIRMNLWTQYIPTFHAGRFDNVYPTTGAEEGE